jgi:ABC-type branched-subunit amino acid transport system substrate-binding protein
MKSRSLSWMGTLILMVLVMSLLFTFGCSNSPPASTPASTSTSTTPAAAETKTLKIGVALTLSMSSFIDALHEMELMVDQDNQKGGWLIGGDHYQIKLIEYDCGTTQDTEKTTINKLIFQDNVKFILTQGIVTNTWASVAESNKVLALQWDPAFAPLPTFNYVFNGNGNVPQNVAVEGWICKAYPEEVKNYVIAIPDSQIGHILGGFVESALKAFGSSPKMLFFPAETQDFGSVAAKVMSYNPTLFTCMLGPEQQTGQVFTAVRQAGYKGLFFFPPSVSAATLIETLSPEALDGLIGTAQSMEFDPPLTQTGKDFKNAWIAKYGKWDNPDMTNSVSLSCLKAALQQAGSVDVDKVASVLSNGLKYESPSSPLQMISRPDVGNDRTVDSIGTYYIKQMTRDGQLKLLATINTDEALSYFRTVYPPLPPGATPPGPPPGAGGPGGPPPDAGGSGGPPGP